MTATAPDNDPGPDPGPMPEPEDRLVDATAPDGAHETGLLPLDFDEGDAETALDGWTIEDLDAATWAARRLHRLNTRRAALKKLRDDQKARLEAWFDNETKRMDLDIRFFAGRLEGFHRQALAADPKHAITIRLPDGSELNSLAGKLAVEVTDIEALAKWAEAHELAEQLLKYVAPEAKKVELGKLFGAKAAQETEPGQYPAIDANTGEIVPGIAIERRARSFTIKGPAGDDS